MLSRAGRPDAADDADPVRTVTSDGAGAGSAGGYAAEQVRTGVPGVPLPRNPKLVEPWAAIVPL